MVGVTSWTSETRSWVALKLQPGSLKQAPSEAILHVRYANTFSLSCEKTKPWGRWRRMRGHTEAKGHPVLAFWLEQPSGNDQLPLRPGTEMNHPAEPFLNLTQRIVNSGDILCLPLEWLLTVLGNQTVFSKSSGTKNCYTVTLTGNFPRVWCENTKGPLFSDSGSLRILKSEYMFTHISCSNWA